MKERIRTDHTVVLVSHNAALIRSVCDRAVWLDHGVSRAEGRTDTVLDAYLADMDAAR